MTAHRNSRQGFLGAGLDRALRSTRIAVIGLCGGGSHIAQQLAHIGFHDVTLVDDDRADLTNLNRMVGLAEADARDERAKVDVIADRYIDVVPNAALQRIDARWEAAQDALKGSHVIFGCVDSYTAREALERFCRRYLIAYIDVGMEVSESREGFMVSGQVIVSVPCGPCMRCIGFLSATRLQQEAERYGAAGGRPQVVWPNGVLASTAVGQMMQMLIPWGPGTDPAPYLVYDANRNALGVSPRLAFVAARCNHFDADNALGDLRSRQ